jgi:hypothetical protein
LTRARKSPLFYEPGLDQLGFIIKILNNEVDGVELRRLVVAWRECDSSLLGLWLKDPELQDDMSKGRFFIQPHGIGGKIMHIPYGAVNPGLSSRKAALAMFTSLMTHPRIEAFGGPCKRCSRYYLRKTTRQSIYCSRRCGAANNATFYTRARREKIHKEKLDLAKSAVTEWTPGRNNRDWKRGVAREAGVTVKWLTRAVNKGDLSGPTKPEVP